MGARAVTHGDGTRCSTRRGIERSRGPRRGNVLRAPTCLRLMLRTSLSLHMATALTAFARPSCSPISIVTAFRATGQRSAITGLATDPGRRGRPARPLGDVCAILDFRFSAVDSLTWYFDHHVSAFVTPEERTFYERRVAEGEALGQRRMFHDGTYSSATKLIADVGRERFGLDTRPTGELVRWADLIDSAAFPSARFAVERREPELKLMTVIEQSGDDAFLATMVPRLIEEPLAEIARSPEIRGTLRPPRPGARSVREARRATRHGNRPRRPRRPERSAHRSRREIRSLCPLSEERVLRSSQSLEEQMQDQHRLQSVVARASPTQHRGNLRAPRRRWPSGRRRNLTSGGWRGGRKEACDVDCG